MNLKFKTFALILFVTGLILFAFNLSGLFLSLRNETLSREITPYKDDISLSFSEVMNQWKQQKNETDREFAIRISYVINNAMAHYWQDEGITKYHMRVPFWENYILALKLRLSGVKKYEFRNYKKAIERGVGICSQPCIALKNLLNHHGIKADLWDLKGHVIVEVKFADGSACVLDPDYGNYVPHGMDEIEANPEIVRPFYINQDSVYASHMTDHRHTDDIVKVYEKDGNHVYYMDRSFEDFSYLAKWLIPILLVVPYTLGSLKKMYADKMN